jgi:nicotinate-nucleotide pyrophosphorylase (carboxylating)
MVAVDNLIDQALSEDIGDGDITTSSILEKPLEVTAHLIGQESLIVAGLDIFRRVYERLDPVLQVNKLCEDGDRINRDDTIAEVNGDVSSILQGERVALNFVQRLSGIATMTREFVSKVEPYSVTILDTRKTTPGLRMLEKYAVEMGGGKNHRLGLFDAILIKDNHINAAGSIKNAVRKVKSHLPSGFTIEVEVKNLVEVKEALDCGVNTIMLDNMSIEEMQEAVALINKKALVEASGGVKLETVEEIARTGVDYISVGALTHSVRAVDMSLKVSGSQPF